MVGVLCVEPIALSRPGSSRTSFALIGAGLRDRRDQQRIQSNARIIYLVCLIIGYLLAFLEFKILYFLFREAGVDNIHDTVDGKRSLCNICGNYTLSRSFSIYG